MIIRECFDACNTFGRSTGALSNIIKRFDIALEDYPFIDIEKAFCKWEKMSDVFPTPANIVRIIEDPQEWNFAAIKDIDERKRNGSQITSYEERYLKEASKPNKAKYAPKPTDGPKELYHMDLEHQLNASPINRKIFGMFAKDDFYKSFVQGTHASFTDLGNNELRLTLLRSKDRFLERYESLIEKIGYEVVDVVIPS